MQAAEVMQNSPVHLRASPSQNRARRDLQPKANQLGQQHLCNGQGSDFAS